MTPGFRNPVDSRPLNVTGFPLLSMEHTQMCTDIIVHNNVTSLHTFLLQIKHLDKSFKM